MKRKKLMSKAVINSILAVFLMCGGVAPSMAQDCTLVEESILRLRPPTFGASRSWDVLYGEVGYERFSDMVSLDSEHVIVAGDFTVGEEDTTYKPMIMQLDYRGRPVWEVKEDTSKDHPIIRITQTSEGITALGEIADSKKGRGLFLAHYDKQGKRTGQTPIFEEGTDLDAVALVETADKKALVVAAQYNSRDNYEDKYGLLYKISKSGKILWRRAYRPGIITFFHDLQKLEDNSYIASGQIRLEDGRLAGWALKLDDYGAIVWQETYPRGKMGSLRGSAPFRDGGYVFVGEVEPSGGGRKSAWVMVVDEVGKVVWQRYFTGDFNYVGHDLIAYKDGRTDVLMTGSALKNRDDRPFVSVLTISPNGVVMDVDSFVDGHGAGAKRLLLGPNNNRFFVGSTQTIVPDDLPSDTFAPFTYDAWLVGLPGLDPFEDPCMVNPLDDIRPIDNDPF